MTTLKEEAWHRRHALQVARSLPDSPEDSLIIPRLATRLVIDFMMQSGEAKKPTPVVAFVRADAS
jgi:hypothetical protein